MEHVLLVVHIIACLALIGVVLLQRSEGGALGMGGGGGGGGLMSGRGAASSLTRATMILGAVFFTTSLVLTSLATRDTARNSALEDAAARSIESSEDLPGDLDLGTGSDALPEQSLPQNTIPSDLDEPEQ